jgi:hypothetical protein|tara:strand:- start:3729 stop:4613 length:885 start_codon:yes stop_codon:yes gene_type:complete
MSSNKSDVLLHNVVSRLLPNHIDECIIVAGETAGKNILAKSRDRNYHARVKIVRDLHNDTELVYFEDIDTGYAEGMNSHGLGIVNSALSISDDEKAKDKTKDKVTSDDGPRMIQALKYSSIDDAVRSLIGFKGGIKGHTFIGTPDAVYSIEMSSEHTPVINKLDPTTGFDVRTNHGAEHSGAGYTPERRPTDYLSSKIRKAQAEVELADIESFDDVAPSLAKQNFSHDSNDNMLRRVPDDAGMVTTSQVAMHLPNREMVFYYFPNECDFTGIEDRTPDDYEPRVNIRVVRVNED